MPIVGVFATHVHDGKIRVDFSGVSGDIPAVDPASPKINIGHEHPIFSIGRVKQFHCVFALNKMVVLDDQDNQRIFQPHAPRSRCTAMTTRWSETLVPKRNVRK